MPIESSIHDVVDRMAEAVTASGRTFNDVELVLATKSRTPIEMFQAAEILTREFPQVRWTFGENFLQEYRHKTADLGQLLGANSGILPPCYFIGSLQSNKANLAAKLFDRIDSVGSKKLLSLLAEPGDLVKKTRILLQVNVSDDASKGGFKVSEVTELFDQVLPKLPWLQVEGLMTITAYFDNCEDVRPDFQKMAQLRQLLLSNSDWRGQLYLHKCELSMGMSRDFDIAIKEGATSIRLGSVVFGERPPA